MADWRDPSEDQKKVKRRSEIEYPKQIEEHSKPNNVSVTKIILVTILTSVAATFALLRVVPSDASANREISDKLAQAESALAQTNADLHALQNQFNAAQGELKSDKQRIEGLEAIIKNTPSLDSNDQSLQDTRPRTTRRKPSY